MPPDDGAFTHQGLLEELAWEGGQLANPSFMDYKIPDAHDVPDDIVPILIEEAPEETGPYGAKGIGESATVGSPAAVVNAVLDAIGVRHADMPLTPAHVWSAIQGRPLRTDLAIG